MSDKVKLRKSTEKSIPDLVKSLEQLGSSEYWRYYDYSDDYSDSDTRSTYSIASLTFQRDRRGLMFPDLPDKHNAQNGETKNFKLDPNNIGLPDISSCVVMTSRRRIKKVKKKPRKKSARYLPEISTEAVQREKEALEVTRPLSSAEEYSPRCQRKIKNSKSARIAAAAVKLPNI